MFPMAVMPQEEGPEWKARAEAIRHRIPEGTPITELGAKMLGLTPWQEVPQEETKSKKKKEKKKKETKKEKKEKKGKDADKGKDTKKNKKPKKKDD